MKPAAAAAPQPLDLRNVYWLLAAMTFVIAPHLLRLPSWVSIFFLVTLGWRAWISWYVLRPPPRPVMWGVTVAAIIGTLVSFQPMLGRTGFVTLLIVMVCLKVLEMRSQRDVVLCIYLGFFLVITNFLFSQSIPLGFYMLACVWIFVATLVGFNHTGRRPTLRDRLKPAASLVLQAVPLMAAFFLLFPRVNGPLLALPQDNRGGSTGLSDSMTPGNIASLIKSEAEVFRVQFDGDMPPYQTLYWRGPVLSQFDGRTWKRQEFSSFIEPHYEAAGRPVRYAVTLESSPRNWLFALDAPGEIPSGARLRADLQLLTLRNLGERYRYDMTSYLDYRYEAAASGQTLRQALRYDASHNPRTIALGKQWAAEDPDPESIMRKAVALFNAQFRYTLEPPPLEGPDPYDQFLFETKQGFCEHYAGTFTLLMRAAGIPARVVTGYQGGEINPINHELVVRQADAHAWSEVWLPGAGWRRIDPTAAVSPLRVESGVNAALGPIGVTAQLMAADRFGVLATMRYAWQAANSHWNNWVVNYNVEKQRDFFSRLGLPQADWRTFAIALIGATLAIAAIITLFLLARDRAPRREAALRAWQRYCGKLADIGLARAPHEGPVDFGTRVVSQRPQLEAAVREITRLYVQARYGDGATREDERRLARLVRDFRAA